MGTDELKKEIFTEIDYLDLMMNDIQSVRADILNGNLSKLHIASVTLYVTQFYNGIENILKRIAKYKKIRFPAGADSHIELFLMFSGENNELPTLFDDSIQKDFTGIRRFRHFAVHGYAFNLDWPRISNSVNSIDVVYNKFRSNLIIFLESID